LIGRDIEAGIDLKHSSDKNWWEEYEQSKKK
jgi:hypothetical protein